LAKLIAPTLAEITMSGVGLGLSNTVPLTLTSNFNIEIPAGVGLIAALALKLLRFTKTQGTLQLEEAIGNAVKYCMEQGVMVPYLKEHGSDIMSILIHEYSYEDEMRVMKEEGIEIGREKGLAEGEKRAWKRNAWRMPGG
jgi:hypothetical protein